MRCQLEQFDNQSTPYIGFNTRYVTLLKNYTKHHSQGINLSQSGRGFPLEAMHPITCNCDIIYGLDPL